MIVAQSPAERSFGCLNFVYALRRNALGEEATSDLVRVYHKKQALKNGGGDWHMRYFDDPDAASSDSSDESDDSSIAAEPEVLTLC